MPWLACKPFGDMHSICPQANTPILVLWWNKDQGNKISIKLQLSHLYSLINAVIWHIAFYPLALTRNQMALKCITKISILFDNQIRAPTSRCLSMNGYFILAAGISTDRHQLSKSHQFKIIATVKFTGRSKKKVFQEIFALCGRDIPLFCFINLAKQGYCIQFVCLCVCVCVSVFSCVSVEVIQCTLWNHEVFMYYHLGSTYFEPHKITFSHIHQF